MSSFASSATMGGARKHAWTKNSWSWSIACLVTFMIKDETFNQPAKDMTRNTKLASH